jgi:hypothetical protein
MLDGEVIYGGAIGPHQAAALRRWQIDAETEVRVLESVTAIHQSAEIRARCSWSRDRGRSGMPRLRMDEELPAKYLDAVADRVARLEYLRAALLRIVGDSTRLAESAVNNDTAVLHLIRSDFFERFPWPEGQIVAVMSAGAERPLH